jgi:hypothetical protein
MLLHECCVNLLCNDQVSVVNDRVIDSSYSFIWFAASLEDISGVVASDAKRRANLRTADIQIPFLSTFCGCAMLRT